MSVVLFTVFQEARSC